MKKPIRIDWDELEVAFSNQSEELVYYLDRVTGHVGLEGEDEGLEDDEDCDQPTPPPVRRDDATRALIEPLRIERKVDWMKRFIKERRDLANAAEDTAVVDRLEAALREDDPAAAISAVLREHAEIRDSWYLYRSESLHEWMQRWLEDKGVTPSEAAPWDA